MFRKIFKPQWFTQPFVKNLIANTLGTIIGIALTIGTTYLVTNIEDRKSERQEVNMLVRSLDNHIDKFNILLENMLASDSVNAIYLDNRHDLSAVADSTLIECMYRILFFDNQVTDYTAAHIFESNIETWRTIRSVEFIETMGKCFTLSQWLSNYHKQLNEDKENLMPIYFQAENELPRNSREFALRFLNHPDVVSFMRKQQELYIMMMGQGVQILELKLDECKSLVGIPLPSEP